jgi:hypothetical protein
LTPPAIIFFITQKQSFLFFALTHHPGTLQAQRLCVVMCCTTSTARTTGARSRHPKRPTKQQTTMMTFFS